MVVKIVTNLMEINSTVKWKQDISSKFLRLRCTTVADGNHNHKDGLCNRVTMN